MPSDAPVGGYVVSASLNGHRRSYVELFSEMFDLKPMVGGAGRDQVMALVRAPRVMFAMLDEHHLLFALVALLRALCGRRTVALSLRLHRCVTGQGLIFRAKSIFFALLRWLPGLTVLTISSFEHMPELRRYAHDCVIDPQLWDLAETAPLERRETDLSKAVADFAGSRKILLVVGIMGADKGIEFLGDFLESDARPAASFALAFVGAFSRGDTRSPARLREAGAFVHDGYISDEDLLSLYGVADCVWSCYAPAYDQPSGVFGRSVQFGVRALVREGSAIDHFAQAHGLCVAPIAYGSLPSLAGALESACEKPRGQRPDALINLWRNDFAQRVSQAL